MSRPTAEQQLAFLTNLQRLLAEGQFVATYKYALLLALADLAVECGDDSGAPLKLSTRQIAEKFVRFYWRQCVPYVPRHDPTLGRVLQQSTRSQATIIQAVLRARHICGDSLADVERDAKSWKSLVGQVDKVVREMPLWKLQTVGPSQLDFLYENVRAGTSIELRAGVAFCLRQFYGLIGDLVRGAWVRYIRRQNHDTLGTTADLAEFLFGSERNDLTVVRGILEQVQSQRCFYCAGSLARGSHVDHFIPWSRYPIDLGHNFVVAHDKCNSAKADHLAAADFLAAWVERNEKHRTYLADEFTRRGVLHDLPTSAQIAAWAYQKTFEVGGLTWQRKDELVSLPADWPLHLQRLESHWGADPK